MTHTTRTDGHTDTAPIPGRTYTGRVSDDTTYTMTSNGSVTTRTYTRTDGATFTTYADVNHMWTTDTDDGHTITYVVAEGTYWDTTRTNIDDTYPRVSSASWPYAATCRHDHAGYGACIAPTGHAGPHRDANGHTFTGPANARYGTPIGPVAPNTYVTPTRVVGGAYAPATNDGVSHLNGNTYRVTSLVARVLDGADAEHIAIPDASIMDAYRLIVSAMASPAYITTPDTYAHTIYTAMLEASSIAPTDMACMWVDVLDGDTTTL